MDLVLGELRRAGLRITPQRVIIYKKISELKGHLSTEDIYKIVKDEIPSISLTTVYRTLRAFGKCGLILPLTGASSGYGTIIFDSNPKLHHHFICRKCGSICDIPETGAKVEVRQKISGKIESVAVVVRGICNNCNDVERCKNSRRMDIRGGRSPQGGIRR